MAAAHIVGAVRTAGGRSNGRLGLLAICEGGGTANCTIIERLA